MSLLYYLKCKTKTDTIGISEKISSNGRNMICGICEICGTNKCVFVNAKNSIKSEKFGGDIQKLLSNVPFSTTGIPGELHLPSHNFAGPGTNLSLRLNTDDTPKDWRLEMIKLLIFMI